MLTDDFGPLSGRSPFRILFGEQRSRPVGCQRHFVDHQLVGIAEERAPLFGRGCCGGDEGAGRRSLGGSRLGRGQADDQQNHQEWKHMARCSDNIPHRD